MHASFPNSAWKESSVVLPILHSQKVPPSQIGDFVDKVKRATSSVREYTPPTPLSIAQAAAAEGSFNAVISNRKTPLSIAHAAVAEGSFNAGKGNRKAPPFPRVWPPTRKQQEEETLIKGEKF